MNRLVLFEGLPGSGKTTLSARFTERLKQEGIPAKNWREGELHPADLSWCACVPDDEWDALLRRFPDQRILLSQKADAFARYHIVAYTQLDFGKDGMALTSEMSRYEIYDGHVSSALFAKMHHLRWQRFAQEAQQEETVSVFECVLLQNHVNEWLLYRGADEEQLIREITALLEPVLPLRPLLIYLQQPDVAGMLRRTGAQRPGWLEGVSRYVAESPYGKANGLHGEEGLAAYFTRRQEIENRIVHCLPCRTLTLSLAIGWNKLLDACLDAWRAGVSPFPQS